MNNNSSIFFDFHPNRQSFLSEFQKCSLHSKLIHSTKSSLNSSLKTSSKSTPNQTWRKSSILKIRNPNISNNLFSEENNKKILLLPKKQRLTHISYDYVSKLNDWDKEHIDNSKLNNNNNIFLSRNLSTGISDYKNKKPITEKDNNYLSTFQLYSPIADEGLKHLEEKGRNFYINLRSKRRLHYIPHKQFFNFNVFVTGSSNNNNDMKTNIKEKEMYSVLADIKNKNYFQKEQNKIELEYRDKLINLYKQLILTKLKKKKYGELLQSIYILNDSAKTEYNLCKDILKERIKSLTTYYNALNLGAYVFHGSISTIASNYNNSKNINSNNNNSSNNNTYIINNNNNNNNELRSPSIRNSRNELLISYNSNIFSNSSSNFIQRDIKRASIASSPDVHIEKSRKYREYVSKQNDIKTEMTNYDTKYDEIKSELDMIIDETKSVLAELTNQISQLKLNIKKTKLEQIKYYLNILKLGLDTRQEGLVWILKRLMELDMNVSKNHFPSFLKEEHISYLLHIAELEFESYEIKQLIFSLQFRNRIIKQNLTNNTTKEKIIQCENMNFKRKCIDTIIKEKIDVGLGNLINLAKSFINKDNVKRIEELTNKTLEIQKIVIENKLEDYYTQSQFILTKKKLIDYYMNNNVNAFKTNYKKEIQELIQHEKEMDYFEDIEKLTQRKDNIDEYVHVYKRNEALKFIKKYNLFTRKKTENDVNDLIYNALFGNKIYN